MLLSPRFSVRKGLPGVNSKIVLIDKLLCHGVSYELEIGLVDVLEQDIRQQRGTVGTSGCSKDKAHKLKAKHSAPKKNIPLSVEVP